MEIIGDYSSFKAKIEDFIAKGNQLEVKSLETEDLFEAFAEEKKAWEKECFELLKNSFSGDNRNEFANDFLETQTFNLGFNLPLPQKAKNVKADLQEKVHNLHTQIKLLEISDAVINPALVKREKRDQWTVQQKKELLLRKLSQLNNGSYYDVEYILSANGVKIRNYDEPRELAKSLELYGFLKIMGTLSGVSACITVNGMDYLESLDVEEKGQPVDSTKPDIEAMNAKMDEVIEWLKRNDMGNEIIFDELQELKEAGKKLDFKNWKQLLMGKLVGLGADKAIGLSAAGAKYIFEQLTGEDIGKLLG